MSAGSAAPLTRALADPAAFAALGGMPLRPYQSQVARAIARSVRHSEGKTFTVTLARQMGKNETSAWIECYLLRLYAGIGGSIVNAAPAFKPQLVTSMLRLQAALERGPLTRSVWRPRYGYIPTCGRANVTFLSADPTASVVGATADPLLRSPGCLNCEIYARGGTLRPYVERKALKMARDATRIDRRSALQRIGLLTAGALAVPAVLSKAALADSESVSSVTGAFVIGDLEAVPGNEVTFWSAQWAAANPMSGGQAPPAFKGWANTLQAPSLGLSSSGPGASFCGPPWSTSPGNSSQPPATVPEFLVVIVASSIDKQGAEISGDTSNYALIRTNPGYAPDPGHAGTGTVITTGCFLGGSSSGSHS